MKSAIFYFLIPFFLFSTSSDPEVAIYEQDIQLVHDIIDPVSGGLVYSSHDFIIRGVEPIVIRRSYGTRGDNLNINGGWLLFSDLDLYTIETGGHTIQLFVQMKDGKGFKFRAREANKTKDCLYTPEICTKENKHSDVYRNTLDGQLSGRTSPYNMRIHFFYKDKAILTLGDGTKKIYLFNKNRHYQLSEEIKPNQNRVFYEYDPLGRIKSIKTTNPSADKTYAKVEFIYEDESKTTKNRNFSVKANGRILGEYKFFRPKAEFIRDCFFLDTLEEQNSAQEKITYDQGFDGSSDKIKTSYYDTRKQKWKSYYLNCDSSRAPFIAEVLQNDVSLRFSYCYLNYNFLEESKSFYIKNIEDPRWNRIRQIFQSHGTQKDPKPLYEFEYQLEGKKILYTHVRDLVTGNKISYKLFNECVPQQIDYFYRSGDKEKLYTETFYYLQSKKKYNKGELGSKLCKDAATDNSICTVYSYDDYGNVKTQTLQGNLSGKAKPLSETYATEYTYYSNHLPKTKKLENGLTIHYGYKSGTDLIESKITTAGTSTTRATETNSLSRVTKRQFFTYNNDNILTSEITDDGTGLSHDDLSNVTIRKIKTIHPRTEYPAINMPGSVEEHYLDVATSEKVLLSKVEYTYNNDSQIKTQSFYGADGNYLYTITNEYDDRGQLISKTDSLGRTTIFTYQKSHPKRLESIHEAGSAYNETFSYDYAGCVQSKTQNARDSSRCFTYTYDLKGNKTEEIDFRGCKTKYKCDGKGQVIEKTLFGIDGNSIQTRHEYDAFGNEILSIDANGNTTKKTYSSLGKVTKIVHPDNNVETFAYNTDGTLLEATDQDGVVTRYTYDAFGRQLTKSVLQKNAKKGTEAVIIESTTYNSFGISSYTDPEGHTTHYFYDGAERKIAQEFRPKDFGKIERTEYGYDNLGRLYYEKNIGENTSLITYTERDLAGREIEVRKEDLHGNLFYKATFRYDQYDNKIEEVSYVDGKEVVIRFDYDDFNRLIQSSDSDNNAYTIEYEDAVISRKISIDPLDVKTIDTFDAFGNLISNFKSKDGILLSLEKMFYDKNGNLTSQVSEIISEGQAVRQVEHIRKYDRMNRLKELIEAKGADEERGTTFSYYPKGHLKSTTKPDGTILTREYDSLGNETRLYSSNENIEAQCKKIDYSYEYNLNGLLLKATDNLTGKQTLKSLDARGRALSETLQTGLDTSYEYDLSGRVVKTTLPDNSSIEKVYDAYNLRSVIRKDANGKQAYLHKYEKYDLSGNLLLEKLGNGKIVQYSFDHLGRIKKLSSSLFSHEVDSYDSVGKILSMHINNETGTAYAYDDLEQLISEMGLFSDGFAYDSHFNRLHKNDEPYLVDSLNQLKEAGSSSYQYDKNGNTSSKSGPKPLSLVYDALDRLVEVKIDGTSIFYTYDSFHRRLTKRIGDKEVLYVYDGKNEIGQVEDNTLIKVRILGNTNRAEMSSAVLLELNGKLYIPIHDLFRNVACLVDGAKVVESYRYSAFGEEKVSESPISPWRFQSKRIDEETGFVNFGRRYYDPEVGRWITTDPKGYAEGVNLYAYVENDPLTRFDLYGLETKLANGLNISIGDASFGAFGYCVSSFCNYMGANVQDEENCLLSGNNILWRSVSRKTTDISDYSTGFGIGVLESHTGIEGPHSNSLMHAYGRRDARALSGFVGKIAKHTGPSMTVGGAVLEISGLGLASCAAGVGTLPGLAISTGGIGIAASGAAVTAYGYGVEKNVSSLKEIDFNVLNKSGSWENSQNGLENSLNHLFGKKQVQKHNLEGFLKMFKGDQKKAFNFLQNSTQKLADSGKIKGIFESSVNFKGINITVRGIVMNGEAQVSTAFIK